MIENRTPYHLKVFRNGIPWEEPSTDAKKNPYHIQLWVKPQESVLISPGSAICSEPVSLTLEAVKIHVGGIQSFERVFWYEAKGTNRWAITLGTNRPAQLVVVRNRDFYASFISGRRR